MLLRRSENVHRQEWPLTAATHHYFRIEVQSKSTADLGSVRQIFVVNFVPFKTTTNAVFKLWNQKLTQLSVKVRDRCGGQLLFSPVRGSGWEGGWERKGWRRRTGASWEGSKSKWGKTFRGQHQWVSTGCRIQIYFLPLFIQPFGWLEIIIAKYMYCDICCIILLRCSFAS